MHTKKSRVRMQERQSLYRFLPKLASWHINLCDHTKTQDKFLSGSAKCLFSRTMIP